MGRPQAPDKEAGHYEQHQRSGDLPDDKEPAQTLPIAAVRLRSAPIVQCRARIRAGGAPRRPDADRHASDDRHQQRERKDARVKLRIQPQREAGAQIESREKRRGDPLPELEPRQSPKT